MSISASQWGSPLASRRALLIHGLTGSSHAWEDIAQLLAAKGFFVIAPNLLGHAWRRSSDYHMSVFAEDLQPYFATDTPYDVIIGHSFGGTVALSLLPFLTKKNETTVILIEPAVELSDEQVEMFGNIFSEKVTNPKTADEYMAESPGWSRSDCVSRALALSMCDSTDIKEIFRQNMPWSFSGLFNNIPSNVKITVLIADPKLSGFCRLEHIPRDMKNLDARVLMGIGHCLHIECPDAIMEAIPLPRT